jgi:hypothetical protein
VPALNEHIIGVMALARANSSWNRFYAQLSAAYPTYNDPQLFLFPPDQVADMITKEEIKENARKNQRIATGFDKKLKQALDYNPKENK